MNSWEITGWDGLKQIFQEKVPCTQITDKQLHDLLRALVAKYSLTPREIVGSYLRRNAKAYLAHLEVSKHNNDKNRNTEHWCGDNPHFVARVIRSSGT